MSDHVFKIKHLMCEYIADSPVLEMSQLNIPRGKLIFVIGKSGIGKSTFIETLGLMNNTIADRSDTEISFFQYAHSPKEELKNAWEMPNKQLSAFRKENFSFIFQNTNLMPNFSSGENMMFSLLIEGMQRIEAKKRVLNVMDRLSLPHEVFEKRITELSGGQRQRLAFVRAITANFTVLFGDEPTGNLDEKTAEELMQILKDLIAEENKTGIIVSHDLSLAIKFADMIIPLTHKIDSNGRQMGSVKEENIIEQKEGIWLNMGAEVCPNPLAYLNEFLNTNAQVV